MGLIPRWRDVTEAVHYFRTADLKADVEETRLDLRRFFHDQQDYANQEGAGLTAGVFNWLYKLVDREGDQDYWETDLQESHIRTTAIDAIRTTYWLDDPVEIHARKEKLAQQLWEPITVAELDAYIIENLDELAASHEITSLRDDGRCIEGIRRQINENLLDCTSPQAAAPAPGTP